MKGPERPQLHPEVPTALIKLQMILAAIKHYDMAFAQSLIGLNDYQTMLKVSEYLGIEPAKQSDSVAPWADAAYLAVRAKWGLPNQ